MSSEALELSVHHLPLASYVGLSGGRPPSLFIDGLTVRFRFLRLRTVDGDRITGKPDSSISAPFYCFASHDCEQPVFEWV